MSHRLAAFVSLMCTAVLSAAPSAVKDSPTDIDNNWPVPVIAPFLSPEAAIKTMHVPAGFHVEVVAAEPMIAHPVACSIDPDGRLWVAEMRSYMPDVEGTGEKEPTGRISVLEDTDGDGRMDKCTVFLDHLVLPRAVSFVRGGVLVATPPNLYFCQDTNGDLKCDKQTLVAADYGLTGNPEHQPNGLLPGIDNWIHSANYDKRLRFVNDKWVAETHPELGQWGITQDDSGRLFFDSNTDQLRGALIPPHYADRNPHYRDGVAGNFQVARDQTVFPLHTTAVDRGYVRSLMRNDGTLLYFTAACAPLIYRGGAFPEDFNGNAFVCEPAGNLIKRDLLHDENNGTLTASNAYPDREFLASTYERFRPVNLYNAPDGSMLVVDMHHGLLQHKVYLTTYCKDQYLARQLEKHLQTGRIYRIVYDGPGATRRQPVTPHLSTAKTPELISYLSHPNGWYRDTSQRLLVERDDFRAVNPLKKLLANDKNPLTRLHALWTLEGLRATNPTLLSQCMSDADPRVRAAAIRIAEAPLAIPTSRPKVLPAILPLVNDPDVQVRTQLALSLTPLGLPETDRAIVALLSTDASSPVLRDAVLTGLRGRELDLLGQLLASPAFATSSPGRPALLQAFARCVRNEGAPKRVAELLKLTAAQPEWRQVAMLEGLVPANTPKRAQQQRRSGMLPLSHHDVTLEAKPTEFLALRKNPALGERVEDVLATVHWPGQPGYTPPPPPRALTAPEQQQFERGRQVYAQICAACHKPTGLGQEGLAPPLADSEWVAGPASRLARIVLHGLAGPVSVNGRSYSLDMPGLAKLSDDDLAAALTFVRRSWENTADR